MRFEDEMKREKRRGRGSGRVRRKGMGKGGGREEGG